MKKIYVLLFAAFLFSGLAMAQVVIVDKALAEDPDLYVSLGDFLMKNNNPEHAIGAYEKCLELDPDNLHALNNLGYYHVNKNPLLAEDYFQKAINIGPNYQKARNNLALLYNKNADYASAIEHLRILVEQDPENIHYNYDLAINLAHNFRYKSSNYDDLEESIYYFKKVYDMQPDFMHAFENIKVLTEIKRTIDNA